MTTVQYATFEVADQLFGVEVSQVQEVLAAGDHTPVPLAPPAVSGLFNLRGQVVVALDLRVLLGLPPAAGGSRAMNVIVRGADASASLLVDRIGDVVELDAAAMQPPPGTITGPARRLIAGAFPLADRVLLALDAPAAVRRRTGPNHGTTQ